MQSEIIPCKKQDEPRFLKVRLILVWLATIEYVYYSCNMISFAQSSSSQGASTSDSSV